MDFPERDLTEDEELEQLVQDIDGGCCVGEFSATGAIDRERQTLFDRAGEPCATVETELLERLVRDGRVSFSEEAHSFNLGERRRVYYVRPMQHQNPKGRRIL